MVRLWLSFVLSCLPAVAMFGIADAQVAGRPGLESPPLSPRESLQLHTVRAGYSIELVAAEPLVVDPIAIDWGLDGSLWVAEMHDYPSGLDGQGQPGGRIRRLYDTDQDGRYDRAELFLEGVRFPTGILSWKDGVLVTAAPEIFYAEDTDGDGTADVQRTLFSGFLQGNQQLRVNGLRRGLDNWVYCASGSHHAGYGKDSQILSHQTGERSLLGSRDFRIQPDQGLIDPQSGPSQYGRNRDDWGNWFGVQNSHPLWHYVLADQDIRRNPHFAPPDPRNQVLVPTNPRVFPAKESQKRFHSFHHSKRFTSACSGMIYRDSLLFQSSSEQHAFTCEPFHNVVQHNVLTEQGVSFTSHRDPAEEEMDFFASADRWCRPVMVRTGPDGALWVVDIYRYMIEHPQWLPEEGQDELRPFFRAGDDRGRIYRIFPDDQPPRPVPRIGEMAIDELVNTLTSQNGWQRDVAQYRIVSLLRGADRHAATAQLHDLLHTSENAHARLHALCTLDGLAALTSGEVEAAMSDSHPAIRRCAVRLAPSHRVDLATLEQLVDDANVKVRLQLAATLGDLADPRAGEALAQLAVANANDVMIRAAAMTSLTAGNVPSLLAATLEQIDRLPAEFVETAFSQIAALGDTAAIGAALRAIAANHDGAGVEWRFGALAEMLDVLQKPSTAAAQGSQTLKQAPLNQVVELARRTVLLKSSSPEVRASAVRLLFRGVDPNDAVPSATDMELAGQLLAPQMPPLVQHAMVAHLRRQSDPRLAELLLADWQSHSPGLRGEILTALANRQSWTTVLLDHVERGSIHPVEIDTTIRRRLAATTDEVRRARIDRLLAASQPADRRAAVAKYQATTELAGDKERGQRLFVEKCATCHRSGDVGHEVGPNLASLTDKSPKSLLSSILDPSSVVEGKYLDYLVVGNDGRSWTGMLATETASSITLLAADGKRETILRGDIEAMRSTGKSLMPDGLEKDISLQGMSDLLRFIGEEQLIE